MADKPPVLEPFGSQYKLEYDTFSEDGSVFLGHTFLLGNLEELITKLVASHRSATRTIARIHKKHSKDNK